MKSWEKSYNTLWGLSLQVWVPEPKNYYYRRVWCYLRHCRFRTLSKSKFNSIPNDHSLFQVDISIRSDLRQGLKKICKSTPMFSLRERIVKPRFLQFFFSGHSRLRVGCVWNLVECGINRSGIKWTFRLNRVKSYPSLAVFGIFPKNCFFQSHSCPNFSTGSFMGSVLPVARDHSNALSNQVCSRPIV